MICVIGARGRLGAALSAAIPDDRIVAPNREVYADWGAPDGAAQVYRFLQRSKGVNHIYVASGILDPRVADEHHLHVNYWLPKNIILAAERYGCRVTTIGTVMERFEGADNAYVRSKRLIGDFVQDRVRQGCPIAHVQVHTLFGVGTPSPFMFLGQMREAIVQNEKFAMSAGTQLREYHHVLDDVTALLHLGRMNVTGTIALSHGDPVRLVDLAKYVFNSLGKEELLSVGELSSAPGENFEKFFKRPDSLLEMEFRETLPAVAEYMVESLRGAQ